MVGLVWELDEGKFLSESEVKRLRGFCAKQSAAAAKAGCKVEVRDWMIIDLALSTGLRVKELADLKCGDLFLDSEKSSLLVRNGKCGKKRMVRFNGSLKKHLRENLEWKKTVREPTNPVAPLFYSTRKKGHMCTRALQKAFKRSAKKSGISDHHSIHSLRHTYACYLYKASGYNLRLVQKSLGHSSIQITEVYADVFNPDMERALRKLYS